MGLLAMLDEAGISKADIDKAIGANASVREGIRAKAKEVQEYWQSIAPVSDVTHTYNGHEDTPGEYRDSIRISYQQKANGFFTAKVFTNNWKAHWLEYGSIHNPEYGFAQKTVDHFNGGSTSDGEGYSVSA